MNAVLRPPIAQERVEQRPDACPQPLGGGGRRPLLLDYAGRTPPPLRGNANGLAHRACFAYAPSRSSRSK